MYARCAPARRPSRADNSDPAIDGRPTGYMVGGVCKPFDFIREQWPARWNLAVPSDDAGSVGQNFRVERNIIRTEEYGPVFAFATVDGEPIALTRQRSTYGGELDTVLPFFMATRSEEHDARSFLEVFNTTTGSFNWFYADDSDIAYIHAGLYPKRAEDTHPDLPSWGNGQYDWQGFLEMERHPQSVNPEQGYLASWNNRPARDWWASDAKAGFGPVYRNDALEIRLQDLVAQGNITRANMVEAMEGCRHRGSAWPGNSARGAGYTPKRRSERRSECGCHAVAQLE